MRILLEKAGDNPDQRPTAAIEGPVGTDREQSAVAVGDVFHVTGRPEDVKLRVTHIVRR